MGWMNAFLLAAKLNHASYQVKTAGFQYLAPAYESGRFCPSFCANFIGVILRLHSWVGARTTSKRRF